MAKRCIAITTVVILLFASSPVLSYAQDSDSYVNPVPGEVSGKPWWEGLDDPVLTSLIEQGLKGNPDLGAIQQRYKQAKAVALANLSPVLPQVTVEFSGREAAIESLGANTIQQMEMAGQDVPNSYRSGTAYLVGRLNLDLFGRNIMSHMAARRDALSSEHNRNSLATNLAVSIARAYYDILAGRERLQAVKTQIKANEELLELLQLRYERGDADGLDVLQQKQQLAATKTQLPIAEAVLENSKQQLAVLLGKAPRDQPKIPYGVLPEIITLAPTGRPSDLTANRPDVKAATAKLKGESLRKKSAIVNFLPDISFYAQGGEQATWINEKEQETVWEVGGTISIPIFQGIGNIANYRQSKAGENAARNDLRRTRLAAIQKVEAALTQQKSAKNQLKAFNAQQEAASIALQQSKSRYISGLTNYQSVLTALNSQQQAQFNLIEARVALIDARITLLDSVGGRWTGNLVNANVGE